MGVVFELFPRLEERKNQLAGTLSGGEQQMLAIGRGLMSRPTLLMLDEPSLGLSPILVRVIFDIIRRINQQGTTILLVEQNVLHSLNLSHRGYVLENGSVVFSGARQDLLNSQHIRQSYLGL
jgi:branched-chain amino acid transport system ATP-binding protein